MDAARFDRLIQTLGRPGTRRGTLTLLLGGALGLLGLRGSAPETEAARLAQRRRVKRQRRAGRRHHDARIKTKKRGKDTAAQGPCGNGSAKANTCQRDGQCCTGYCHKRKNRCRCKKPGQSCAEDRNCCAAFGQPMTCQNGTCQTVTGAPPPSPPVTAQCQPEPASQTCAGRCGIVANTCGNPIDCGPCSCGAPCLICQTCDTATGQCVLSPTGTACGGPGQTCQNGVCGMACGGDFCPGATEVCDEGACVACDVCATCTETTVQGGIDAATSGDTVVICAGSYGRTPPTNRVANIVGKDLTVVGAGAGITILDGGGALSPESVVLVNNSTSELRGLTVTGSAIRPGIGVSFPASLTLADVTVSGNTVGITGGAGIFNQFGTVTLNAGGSVTGNTTTGAGGGIFNNGGTVTLNAGSSVTGNMASLTGGGITNDAGGTVTLNPGSQVCGNSDPDCFNVADPNTICQDDCA